MLYMVQCGFSDPAREQAWNDWYGGERLDQLLSVPGFRGSQRFKAWGHKPSRYLAVHWIASLDVFASAAYKRIGGGGFLNYQDCITDWVRRFFCGWNRPLPVADDERLLVADGARPVVSDESIDWSWLAERGAEPGSERWIARVAAHRAATLQDAPDATLHVYVPLGAWRAGRHA